MNFKNPFRRNKIPHPDGVAAYYTAGIVFDGGAEHLAYHNDRPHPLLTSFGGFLTQRQFQVKTPAVVYQLNSLPLQGLLQGVQAGQLLNPGPLLQNGSLSGTPNNVNLNTSLFGGVQA